jgi:putative membrane protein
VYGLRLLIGWLLSGLAFLGVSKALPGFRIGGFGTALVVAGVYSLLHVVLHFLLFRIFWMLTLPFVILTFGLVYFAVNAVILWLTDKLVEDFRIDGLATLVIAAVLLTVLNAIIRVVLVL